MGMRKIPKDTELFHFFNANPKNRAVGDCSTRALSLFLDIPWAQALELQYKAALKLTSGITDTEVIDLVLKERGYPKQKKPRKENGNNWTAGQMAQAVDRNKVVLCRVANHYNVIKLNQVWDIWNSTRKMIYNYWVREV